MHRENSVQFGVRGPEFKFWLVVSVGNKLLLLLFLFVIANNN